MERTVCVMCGKPVGNFLAGGDAETCSGVCRKALATARESIRNYWHRHSHNGASGECVICGAPTKVASSSGRPQKYCGDSCRNKRISKLQNERRECVVCGGEFIPRSANNICCSIECTYERKRQASSKSVREDGHCHRRRSVKYGVKYDKLDPFDIYKRDCWICQICMAPVNQDVAFPHPLSATLDHVVPLSRGGSHTIENVRLAHWCCNSAKGAKLDGEVRCQVEDHQRQQLH